MKVISPFGPRIGKFKLSSQVIKRINKEVKISTINNQGDIEGLEI